MAKITSVSPLAPGSFPDLPVISGVRFASASAGVRYAGRTDVMLALLDPGSTMAGVMDKASGIFSPSGAGPNPERKYDTNNAGNLRVSATARGQSEAVSDDAQLIVTVQRWNNPPLR